MLERLVWHRQQPQVPREEMRDTSRALVDFTRYSRLDHECDWLSWVRLVLSLPLSWEVRITISRKEVAEFSDCLELIHPLLLSKKVDHPIALDRLPSLPMPPTK